MVSFIQLHTSTPKIASCPKSLPVSFPSTSSISPTWAWGLSSWTSIHTEEFLLWWGAITLLKPYLNNLTKEKSIFLNLTYLNPVRKKKHEFVGCLDVQYSIFLVSSFQDFILVYVRSIMLFKCAMKTEQLKPSKKNKKSLT